MANLPTTRTTASTAEEHVSDHNTLHAFHNLIDAAGDLIVGTGADTAGRLAKGAASTVLRVNAAGTALEWAAPAGGSAAATSYAGSAGLSATDVEAALDELDSEKLSIAAASAAFAPVVAIARYRLAAAQSIATGTSTNIAWDTVVREDGLTRAVPFTTFPVPSAGWYLIEAGVRWAANTTNTRRISLKDDLGAFYGQNEIAPTSAGNTLQTATFLVYVAAGRSLSVTVTQSTGVALNVESFQEDTHLTIQKVR